MFLQRVTKKFYDSLNKTMYPPVKSSMKSKRYFALLNARGAQSERIFSFSDSWNTPFECDRQLLHAMNVMCSVCSKIGFVNEISIVGLDDDLLRLRSSIVDDIGLTRTRKKSS